MYLPWCKLDEHFTFQEAIQANVRNPQVPFIQYMVSHLMKIGGTSLMFQQAFSLIGSSRAELWCICVVTILLQK